MKQDLNKLVQQWMEQRFPTVNYRLKQVSEERAIVHEEVDGKVVDGSRVWKWKKGALRGWVKWEGPDR